MADATSTSFWNSPIFHNHIRTWTFVILALCLVGYLFVHESNTNAAQAAVATQVLNQGTAQKADLDKQIQAIHDDTKVQVAAIQSQINQVQTVAQAITSLKQTIPPVTITPIITAPATPTTPAQTTASEKAIGDVPVATITGSDLKILSDNALTCKATGIELSSCQQNLNLEQQKEAVLQTEVDTLKKVKIVPAWKKTLTTIGHIALGVAIGRVL